MGKLLVACIVVITMAVAFVAGTRYASTRTPSAAGTTVAVGAVRNANPAAETDVRVNPIPSAASDRPHNAIAQGSPAPVVADPWSGLRDRIQDKLGISVGIASINRELTIEYSRTINRGAISSNSTLGDITGGTTGWSEADKDAAAVFSVLLQNKSPDWDRVRLVSRIQYKEAVTATVSGQRVTGESASPANPLRDNWYLGGAKSQPGFDTQAYLFTQAAFSGALEGEAPYWPVISQARIAGAIR